MRVYISGPISENPAARQDFARVEHLLQQAGIEDIINPEAVLRRLSLTHGQYLHICKALVEIADVMVLMPGWRRSTGACIEVGVALARGIDAYEIDEDGQPRLLDLRR